MYVCMYVSLRPSVRLEVLEIIIICFPFPIVKNIAHIICIDIIFWHKWYLSRLLHLLTTNNIYFAFQDGVGCATETYYLNNMKFFERDFSICVMSLNFNVGTKYYRTNNRDSAIGDWLFVRYRTISL